MQRIACCTPAPPSFSWLPACERRELLAGWRHGRHARFDGLRERVARLSNRPGQLPANLLRGHRETFQHVARGRFTTPAPGNLQEFTLRDTEAMATRVMATAGMRGPRAQRAPRRPTPRTWHIEEPEFPRARAGAVVPAAANPGQFESIGETRSQAGAARPHLEGEELHLPERVRELPRSERRRPPGLRGP